MELALLRTVVKKIEEEILNTVKALFAKRLIDEELTVDNLKDRLNSSSWNPSQRVIQRMFP